jgi:hypothetical protein
VNDSRPDLQPILEAVLIQQQIKPASLKYLYSQQCSTVLVSYSLNKFVTCQMSTKLNQRQGRLSCWQYGTKLHASVSAFNRLASPASAVTSIYVNHQQNNNISVKLQRLKIMTSDNITLITGSQATLAEICSVRVSKISACCQPVSKLHRSTFFGSFRMCK